MLRNPNQRVTPVEPPHDDETASALASLGPPIALFRVFAGRPARARAIHGWGRYYLSRRSGAVDLMLLCGWYHAISYVARAARLPLEPGSPTFAEVAGNA